VTSGRRILGRQTADESARRTKIGLICSCCAGGRSGWGVVVGSVRDVANVWVCGQEGYR
jgi:hypothetical protein